MKFFLLFVIFATVSLSAQAKVCEIKVAYHIMEDKVVLSLEDKDNAVEEEFLRGLNSENLDCDSLIAQIKEKGKRTVTIHEREVPLQIVYTINL